MDLSYTEEERELNIHLERLLDYDEEQQEQQQLQEQEQQQLQNQEERDDDELDPFQPKEAACNADEAEPLHPSFLRYGNEEQENLDAVNDMASQINGGSGSSHNDGESQDVSDDTMGRRQGQEAVTDAGDTASEPRRVLNEKEVDAAYLNFIQAASSASANSSSSSKTSVSSKNEHKEKNNHYHKEATIARLEAAPPPTRMMKKGALKTDTTTSVELPDKKGTEQSLEFASSDFDNTINSGNTEAEDEAYNASLELSINTIPGAFAVTPGSPEESQNISGGSVMNTITDGNGHADLDDVIGSDDDAGPIDQDESPGPGMIEPSEYAISTDGNRGAAAAVPQPPALYVTLSATLAPDEGTLVDQERQEEDEEQQRPQPPTNGQPERTGPFTLSCPASETQNTSGSTLYTTTSTRRCHVSANDGSHDDADSPNHTHHPSQTLLVDAKVVTEYHECLDSIQRWYHASNLLPLVIIFILILTVILMVLGLAGVLHYSDDDRNHNALGTVTKDNVSNPAINPADATSVAGPTTHHESTPSPTLQQIREDGFLQCAHLPLEGMARGEGKPDEDEGITIQQVDQANSQLTGFGSVWCQAVAAAIFGSQKTARKMDNETTNNDRNNPSHNHIRLVPFDPGRGQFGHLNTVGIAHTMQRHSRYAFTRPYYYDGFRVGGDPYYVKCAVEQDFKHYDECAGLRACVLQYSSIRVAVDSLLPERRVTYFNHHNELLGGLVNGTCNVIIAETQTISEQSVRSHGYQGDYMVGNNFMHKEPWALMTNKSDPYFGDFVNAVIQSTLVAEQQNITQATASLFPQTTVFGDDYKNMFRHTVAAVGNYAEIYQRYMAPFLPRERINRINRSTGNSSIVLARNESATSNTSGLLYSHPLGEASTIVEDVLDPYLQNVLNRGHLLCGIRLGRPGFAMMKFSSDNSSVRNGDNRIDTPTPLGGMDVELCHAAAAGLFQGDKMAVKFVVLSNQTDGYHKLAQEEIDVMAGATWNLVNDVNETTTGFGFAFTKPYFYGYSLEEDNLCLATKQHDHDWLTYIYWSVEGLVLAEERDITQLESNEMPMIGVFGSRLGRMFRDIVNAVGNYGQMYERNLQAIIPRGGRNLLNTDPRPGPQHYCMPDLP